MTTVSGALLGLVVLSAAGVLPAFALARARLVTIPLVPLTGAVIASLAVTGMAGVGGSVGEWFVFLSVVSAGAVAFWWWQHPLTRPWHRDEGRTPATGLCAAGLGLSAVAAAFGLSALKAPMVSYDARTTWMVHPAWYLLGHHATVAALRDPAMSFAHPPYPPFVGGAVAMTWLVSGLHSDRLGVVMLSLLGACTALAAASAALELARTLSGLTEDRRRRTVISGAGVVAMVLLVMVAIAAAAGNLVNGYADALWSSAAVGAVAYGLILPSGKANLGAAAILVDVAGTTKLEASLTAAVIVGLVVIRLLLQPRPAGEPRAWQRIGAFGLGSWLVIGSWPVVIRLIGALPDTPIGGPREGTDRTRLDAVLPRAWGELHIVAVALAIAVIGMLLLRATRKRAALGSELWAWLALLAEVVIVGSAYVVGPGDIHSWLDASIRRTMMFPVLVAYWVMATWAVIAIAELCLLDSTESATEPAHERLYPTPLAV